MNNDNHENGYAMELPKLPQDQVESSAYPVTEITGAKAGELPSIGQPAPLASQHGQPADSTPQAQVPVIDPTIHALAPQIADDTDLIEKEWVLKAKAIVANTKDDPYAQNKEIGQYKVDYIKKRFNKDIRAS